jgi:hypothetical protein
METMPKAALYLRVSTDRHAAVDQFDAVRHPHQMSADVTARVVAAAR